MNKYRRDRWEIYKVFLPKGYTSTYIAVEKGISISNIDQAHNPIREELIESNYLDDLVDLEFKHTARSRCDICGRDTAYYNHGEGICEKDV